MKNKLRLCLLNNKKAASSRAIARVFFDQNYPERIKNFKEYEPFSLLELKIIVKDSYANFSTSASSNSSNCSACSHSGCHGNCR